MKYSFITSLVSALFLGLCLPSGAQTLPSESVEKTNTPDPLSSTENTQNSASLDDFSVILNKASLAELERLRASSSASLQESSEANAPLVSEQLPEPDDNAMRIAFIMPDRGSPFDRASQLALKGLLAANYASEHPSRVLLIYPGSNDSIIDQLKAAANAGAMAAVGPIDRNQVEKLSQLAYLPLPVVTLNQVHIDTSIALTPEEIAYKREQLRLEQFMKQLSTQQELLEQPTLSVAETSTTENAQSEEQTIATPTELPDNELLLLDDTGVRIAAKTSVPGLVLAEDLAVSQVRYEPIQFPRNLLMLGLSMEDDAAYVARLGISALPKQTESGERPKVLLLDHDSALEKRISEAFEKELVAAGFAPDRLTVDLSKINRINQLFKLIVDGLNPEEFNEVLIDQEADPVGWRRQQIRIRRLQAAKRARAALAEPPYYAAFLAMDAKSASLVRSRLPIRTRVWGTPMLNPGNTKTNPQAKAMTYDLLQVALTEAPLLLNFDRQEFEQTYQVPAPQSPLETRLFALGADAWQLAQQLARGAESASLEGHLGKLHYDLTHSPLVERRGQTAMIVGGTVKPMDEQDLVDYQVIDTNARRLAKMRAQSRSLEKLEKEAQAQAHEAGTLLQETQPQQSSQSPETITHP